MDYGYIKGGVEFPKARWFARGKFCSTPFSQTVYVFELSPYDIKICENCSILVDAPVRREGHACPHRAHIAPEVLRRRDSKPPDVEVVGEIKGFKTKSSLLPIDEAYRLIELARQSGPMSEATKCEEIEEEYERLREEKVEKDKELVEAKIGKGSRKKKKRKTRKKS